MPNTATIGTPARIICCGASKVFPVTVNLDTIDTDLTIFDPVAEGFGEDYMVGVVGIDLIEQTATNLTFASDSTANGRKTVKHFPDNWAYVQGIRNELIFFTDRGEKFVMQTSVAIDHVFEVSVICARIFDMNYVHMT